VAAVVSALAFPAAPARADDSLLGRIVETVTYGLPGLRCDVTDPRLDEISGMATGPDGYFVMNDKGPGVIYEIGDDCGVEDVIHLGVRIRDTEDLARSPDGTIWVGDIGGNRFRRTVVKLFRLTPDGDVRTFRLSYPDGPHDAEALLISPSGELVIVTKRREGIAGIYTAPMPDRPWTRLRRVGSLDVRQLRPDHRGSQVVTGGAVAADGGHFVLRTYTTAYEWDMPDGDIASALLHGDPRAIPLAETLQGEAVTYSQDGNYLLTTGERLPAPVHAVEIVRVHQSG
jgi:hypothetical protein